MNRKTFGDSISAGFPLRWSTYVFIFAMEEKESNLWSWGEAALVYPQRLCSISNRLDEVDSKYDELFSDEEFWEEVDDILGGEEDWDEDESSEDDREEELTEKIKVWAARQKGEVLDNGELMLVASPLRVSFSIVPEKAERTETEVAKEPKELKKSKTRSQKNTRTKKPIKPKKS
ncbi:unnamed protein product [Blepharisma stoltei]|uniref:Uncharacterized protein n=1 Tax=Blepharisma stoltei TaxID=1481888 RepID=A0AAU9I9Q4_9CILI|nr:unnamed protein product [Blepharisma stoltei]